LRRASRGRSSPSSPIPLAPRSKWSTARGSATAC